MRTLQSPYRMLQTSAAVYLAIRDRLYPTEHSLWVLLGGSFVPMYKGLSEELLTKTLEVL